MHKVVIYGISENMTSLVQSVMYGAINTSDTTTNISYVIKFISESYTLQNNTTIDGILFLGVNYLSRHNIFAQCKKTLIGIGRDIYWNRLL